MAGWPSVGSCYVGPRSFESKEMVLPLIMGKSTCRAKSRKNSGMSRSSATACHVRTHIMCTHPDRQMDELTGWTTHTVKCGWDWKSCRWSGQLADLDLHFDVFPPGFECGHCPLEYPLLLEAHPDGHPLALAHHRKQTSIRYQRLVLSISRRIPSHTHATGDGGGACVCVLVVHLCSISAHCSMTVSSTLFSRASLNGLKTATSSNGHHGQSLSALISRC